MGNTVGDKYFIMYTFPFFLILFYSLKELYLYDISTALIDSGCNNIFLIQISDKKYSVCVMLQEIHKSAIFYVIRQYSKIALSGIGKAIWIANIF